MTIESKPPVSSAEPSGAMAIVETVSVCVPASAFAWEDGKLESEYKT